MRGQRLQRAAIQLLARPQGFLDLFARCDIGSNADKFCKLRIRIKDRMGMFLRPDDLAIMHQAILVDITALGRQCTVHFCTVIFSVIRMDQRIAVVSFAYGA